MHFQPHEIGKARNRVLPGYPVFEILPKTNPQLAAGLLQARKGVTAAAPQITASRSADLALLHVFPDVCLTCIVVQRHVRSFQHHQKLRLVLVDPLQGLIQGLIARVCGEYFIKTLLKLCFLFRARTLLVGFST